MSKDTQTVMTPASRLLPAVFGTGGVRNLLRKAMGFLGAPGKQPTERIHIPKDSLDKSQVNELENIFRLRRRALNLSREIRQKADRFSDQLPPIAAARIIPVLQQLPVMDAIKAAQRVTLEAFLNSFYRVAGTQTEPAFTEDLTAWKRALKEQTEALLRLQRYVETTVSKIPVQIERTQLTEGEREELLEMRRLNMELIACEVLLGIDTVESVPSNLQVEPTDRCNARCKSCGHRSPAGWSYHDLNVGTLDNLNHVVSIAQFVEILGYGEPTMAPAFAPLVELCARGGTSAHVITNGTFLNKNPSIGKLERIGISFDGATKETFETLRVGINFDSLVENIALFRQQHPNIFMYFTVTVHRGNVAEIPGIARLAKTLGLQAVCFHRMSMGIAEMAPTQLSREDLPTYKKAIEDAKQELAGTEVKLFDYLIPDELNSNPEPLDCSQSLLTIKSFKPAEENFSNSLDEALEKLKTQAIPLGLHSSNYEWSLPESEPPPAEQDTSASESGAQHPRSLSRLELQVRVAELKAEIQRRGPSGIKIPFCLAGWYRLVVKATGDTNPCCSWTQTTGNLAAAPSFDAVWNGSYHLKLRRSFTGKADLVSRCASCISIDRYQGMTELLHFLRSLGITYAEVPKADGFNPPEGKLQL